MQNKLIYVIAGLFLVFVIVIPLFIPNASDLKKDRLESESTSEDQFIGGQRDEYGCLGPAGYSWCEEKNKCVRVWEEGCDEVTTVLAELNNETSETFSDFGETTFDWKIGESGVSSQEVTGNIKRAGAITADLDYEINHFFISNGYITDDFNVGDVAGYIREDLVCILEIVETDMNEYPEVTPTGEDFYDFIVKCGELE